MRSAPAKWAHTLAEGVKNAECPHVRGYHESEGAKKISCGVQRTLKSVSILSRAGVLAPMGAQGLQNTPPRPHTAVKPYSSATQRCQVREQATKIEARRWSSWPHRPRILKSKIWGIHLGQGIIYSVNRRRPIDGLSALSIDIL